MSMKLMDLSKTAGRKQRWEENHAGGPATIKMLNVKVDPEMSMKTKDGLTQ
jgi:hypothetical protein